ncbi:hypothetical protein [Streptomyces sp. NPDC060322]|uniref:phage tail protein n=1 Tax=Streptomyces sp. NPDC060322 TaxID=3347097 RepID=UPI0036539868
MADTSLVFNLVARDRASQELEALRAKLGQVGTSVTKLAGAGIALPGLAAAVTGAAGLAAGAVAAGLAVKAFTAAAGPQVESVTESWALYEAAQKAAAVGGEQAAAAQAAYVASLADMTPATRESAKAFIGLKTEYATWSDEMSGSTMPVFTQGIELLRDLLPTLTPFVQSAAAAIGGFLDEVAVGVQSAGFKEWAAGMAAASGPALTDFLTTVKNLGVGFAGLLSAFLPVSDGMTGGLAEMSAGFATWGTELGDSAGFAKFMDLAATGGDTLALLGSAAVNLLSALAPLLGTTAMLANGLARIVNSTPTPVLTALAAVLVSVKTGMLLYSAASAVVAAKNTIMAASQTPVILGWIRMNAVGLAAMLRIAATSAVSAAATAAAWVGSALVGIGTWIAAVVRAAITAAAQFLLMAARAVAWAAVMAAQWLIAMGPIGWVIAAIVGLGLLIWANWDKIKVWTAAAWDWVWNKIKGVGQLLLTFFLNFTLYGLIIKHWDTIKSATAAAWDWVWGKIRGIGVSIVTTVGGFVANAVSRFEGLKRGVATKATALVGYVAGLPGRLARGIGSLTSLLVEKGRNVVQGLWNGIAAMGPWIASKISGWAKSVIPGPIAKALGIASPSRVTAAQGRWIGRGLADGLTGSAKQVKAAAGKLADIVRSSMAPGKKRTNALKAISSKSQQLVALANKEVSLAARMKTATKSLADQIKARDKLAADVKKGVLDSANITANTSGGQVSAQSILATLQQKMQQARQFAAQLATLRKKGIRSDLIAQIAQAGVEQGAGSAAALAAASSSQIKQINTTQAALTVAADQAGATAGTAMYGAGIQAAQGLVKGLKSQQKAIEKQMASIAKSMASSIKKALGIHSPSRLMADEVGSMVPAGIVEGMADGQAPLDRAMADIVRPPSAPTAGISMAPRQAAPLLTAGGGQTRLRIEISGREEVKRLIRTIVREDGAGDVQRTFGRKEK